MTNSVKRSLFVAALMGALCLSPLLARADGDPSPPAKSKTGSSTCNADSDCKGILPAMCRKCPDGKTHCARHVCNDHQCAVETCSPAK